MKAEKLFPCRDCRFRGLTKPEGGHLICRRNPPTCGNSGDEFPMVWLDGSTDCFAGEPREQRSCANCAIRATINCPLNDEIQYPLCSPKGWHCSDWSAKDGGKQ
jgi:hypothetical protein